MRRENQILSDRSADEGNLLASSGLASGESSPLTARKWWSCGTYCGGPSMVSDKKQGRKFIDIQISAYKWEGGLWGGTGAPPVRIRWGGQCGPLEGRSPRLTWVRKEDDEWEEGKAT